MAAYLQKHGWPNAVASHGGKLEYELSLLGVPHHKIPLASKNPFTILFNALRLASLLRSSPFSIVHVRSRAPAWSTWLALQACFKKQDRPHLVSTFHGTYGANSAIKRLYNSVMLQGTVIANSAFIARHITATYHYPQQKITLAQRGVDLTRLEQENAGFSTSPWSHPVPAKGKSPAWKLLCVGRLTRWKGQHALLEAMAEVQKQEPGLQWELAFVGGADRKNAYVKELRALGRSLGLDKNILWLGSRSDILALNASADLAISPSLRPEAFGRATIEAMAMGTPVVATKLGGSLETVVEGKTGWLVDVAAPGEDVLTSTHPKIRADVPQVLAKSIIHALTDPARLATMGEEASRHVRQRFTSNKTCAAEMAAYEKALGITPAAIRI
jgi:glycosyltransferase involved in cell wall biosynthesis